MKQRPWFERAFPFPVDPASAPEILARLRGTPARLDELLRDPDVNALIAKPDGAWSAQENVGHLWDLEPLWLGRLEDFLSGADELRTADLRNRKTYEALHNKASPRALLIEFRKARTTFVARLESLNENDWKRAARHPRLQQPMTVTDHAFFVAEHDDNHLARIAELLTGP
jgi:hypothetical protein